MPKRIVFERPATVNVSGTHSRRVWIKNPPAYAFQTRGGDGHAGILSVGTGPLLPHITAARKRQALGTLTATVLLPARMTRPALRQYAQGRSPVATTCIRRAGGAERTPSTTR